MQRAGQIRSTDRDAYQHTGRAVAAMAKEFAGGETTGEHSHPRAQLLYAVKGTMRARTAEGAWFVPPGHALWIPPSCIHQTYMQAAVSMRTLYVRAKEALALSAHCRAIAVTPLLREMILALIEEPLEYEESGRGGQLATLILQEIHEAASEAFDLPAPKTKSLIALCEGLAANPAKVLNLDHVASEAGLSRRTLTRRFRDETGLSLGDWQRRLRVLEAEAQLSGGMKGHFVARRVGYTRVSSLNAMLRRNRLDSVRPSTTCEKTL